ncbi:MAG: hypothetical protein CVU90_15650 [Firmicutes bacterium HGW-Firmicutes-15]|nr:MAG: hypothetical protein CVU90_15650 [Firmicutes bacterium HGW-Firmicutes-15]
MEVKYREISIELNNRFPVYQEYFDLLVDFYKDYIIDINELKKFMESVFNYHKDQNNNIPRLMINNTMRLATLANDMEKIRPGKDALKIANLITCIETLYYISGKKKDRNGQKLNKVGTIIDFFGTYISAEDEKYILQKVRRSLADDSFIPGEPFEQKINMGIFARIINETRNIYLHEGDYWSNSLSHMDCPVLYIMNVEEVRRTGKQERVYEYELKYEELHQIFLRAFINFIEQYMNEMSSL